MVRMDFWSWTRRRVPMLAWLPLYTPGDGLSDLVAGLTVGLTLIPQAIAYAALAGLGPQYGLYSAFAGSLVYIAFGTCREVNIGPTALLSLLTYTYARGVPEYAVLLCFLSGCVTLALGLLHLGFLVELVSAPVVSGFTSAASLIIACSQIKGLLGIKTRGEGFIEIWKGLYENVNATRIPDLILSCCCVIVLITLREIKDIGTSNKTLSKFLWLLGTGRNAMVVVGCAAIAYIFEIYSTEVPFHLTGHIESGLPPVGPPQYWTTAGNRTVGFLEMCTTLGSGIIIVPLVSVIANVAIAKAFSHGQTLDATQEMVTLGLCNIAGSFFSSMPVCGSFSRSAVNNASGVRSPMGGLYTGVLVILALSLLTPYFYYIPKATLSSVIICAVIFMVDVDMIKPIWRCNRRDLIPAAVTFLACLFAGVELGILMGVAVDIVILVYLNARPGIEVEHRTSEPAYVIVRPRGGLFFPAVDYFRGYLTKYVSGRRKSLKAEELKNVVLDCKHVHRIDFTVVQGINAVLLDLKRQGCHLIFLHPKQDILQSVKSLAKDPILSAHSELELITILKQIENGREPDAEARLEITDLPNSITRRTDVVTVSTNL